MTAKEKLAAAKSGKRVTTSDGKTRTTTKGGWSITSGVQKKTLAPKHKASPKSTAGRSIKYHGGKAKVVDLGHNPTKSAISKGTTKLRTASKAAKPRAKKNAASTVATVKIPQEGAPTVPSTPKKPEGTSLGAKVAVGAIIGGGAAVGAAALLKGSKKPAKVKIPRTNLPAPQLGLPGGKAGSASIQYDPPKNLPAPPKGLPGPKPKPTRRQIVDDLRAKSAPKVAKVVVPSAGATAAKTPTKPPTLSERHTARRAEQGAKLKNAFGAAERADARRAAAKTPSATAGFGATEADIAKVAKSGEAVKAPSTEKAAANKAAVVTAPKEVQDMVAEIDKAAAPKKVKPLTGATVARVTGVGAAKPKAKGKPPTQGTDLETLRQRAAVPKAEAPKVARMSPDILGGVSADQGKLPPVVKGVTPPKADPTIPKVTPPEAKANVAPQPKVARVAAGGAEAKDVYKEAREALRSGDTGRMKAAVGKLPEGTKKTAKFTQNLEAGIQAAGNRPPPSTPAPKADAPAPEAPKAEAPKIARVEGVPAPAAKAPKNLKRDLARARATNEKYKAAAGSTETASGLSKKDVAKIDADVAKVEAPKSTAPISDTAPEATKAAATGPKVGAVEALPRAEADIAADKKKRSTKSYYKNRNAARRATRDASIVEKGIMTVPTDAEAGSVEGEEAKLRSIQNKLLDASLAEDRGRVTTAPKTVGAATDKRTAVEIAGKEAVESKVRVIPSGPRDLETEHGGGRQRGTIAGIINQDTDLRDARNEEIRTAAAKARTIAASRSASPAQDAALEKAVDAEYDRSLELYFDDVETDADPKNQRGPRKPDARPRLLDSMIEADAELARERGSASPPAPADRTTIDQKIAEVEKRRAPGGESIYRGEDTLRMLENLRDQKPAEVTPPKSTRALPSAGAAVAEQFSSDRPSIKRARQAGINAGEAAAKAKALSGEAGPVRVPDMTKPGVIPAGPKTPPATPAVEHGVVKGAAPKTMAQLWTGRMADWGRSAYQAQVKRLSAPYLDVVGEKAKGTYDAEKRVKASNAARVAGKVGTGLGAAAVAFTALGAGEAYAKEHDRLEGVRAAGKQFKEELPYTVGSIAAFTAKDVGVSKVIPSLVKKAGVFLGANATRAAFAAGASRLLGRGLLAYEIGKVVVPSTAVQLAKLGHEAVEAKKAGRAATDERKASEAKYGTKELATRTRHAKEAEKRRKAKEKT